MTELDVPSNNFSSMGGTELTERLFFETNLESTKQWVDPESTSAEITMEELEMSEDVSGIRNEFGSERADALSRTTSIVAQEETTQSSACAEVGGLLTLFSRSRPLSLCP